MEVMFDIMATEMKIFDGEIVLFVYVGGVDFELDNVMF